MPGLLRGVARTAVIAGTATHVSNNVSRRQATKWAQQDAAAQAQQPVAQPAPAEAQDTDVYLELEKLGQLHSQGILTDEEFNSKKQQLLGL